MKLCGMATFVLIHGGGASGWDWHLLVPQLQERGHRVVTPDMPIEDGSAGFTEFAAAAVQAVGDNTDLVVVGHSYGGFTAPLVSTKLPVRLLVTLNAMIPAPGESPGEWWGNTGFRDPVELSDDEKYYDGIPADLVEAARAHGRNQVSAEWGEAWPLDAWPDVPTKVLIGRDDRFFAPAFQRRVAGERLGVVADEVPGGHSLMLSYPKELAAQLTAYLND